MSGVGHKPAPGSYPGHRELVYENPYHYVFRVRTVLAGRDREYFVTDYGERAAVVVVRGAQVLLVRQHRLFLDHLSWELPGGRINDGESAEHAAVRECLEETGVRCGRLRPLLRFHPGLDSLYNPSFLFQADVENAPEGSFDRAEVETTGWVPFDRCLDMIRKGEIVDSISILGLLSFQAFGSETHDRP
jgi:8-oxo-dGTP pyrophosphatase MutT (NUDIX family)